MSTLASALQARPAPPAAAAAVGPAVQDRRPRPELLLRPKRALEDITIDIPANLVTAFIGPSGCGKSTFLRTLNRMNDIIPGTRVDGHGQDRRPGHLRGGIDVVALRRRVGMVFQKSNPFPKSIFENVAYGAAHQRPGAEPRRAAGARRGEPEAGGALGRGQGPAARLRAGALGRPAAAAVHRARAGGQARGPADGRAGVGARPDRHAAHRGADLRAQDRPTRSSSSRTTCSRRRASRTSPRSSGSARWSKSARPIKIFTNPGQKLTEDYVTGQFG